MSLVFAGVCSHAPGITGRAQRLAETVELRVEFVLDRRVGQVCTPGNAGGVAAHACENKTHTPATFSSWAVVIA